ncbi:MAG TPA: cysteine--tRNA ligase [Vicinamibacterales bacterium]
MTDLRAISLFNTLTRQVEPVTPLAAGELRIYNCGPTIYNYVHIGNLRTFLFQDLLRRTFEAAGYRVTFCMNLTDVEDKIIRDSQTGLPADADNETRLRVMRAFTDTYERAFLEDMEALRVERPTIMPRATSYMAEMIRLVTTLETRGLAYERDGSVYFRVSGFPQYGCLSHIDRAGMQLGTSVDSDEYDRDSVSDFVLWKGTKPGEPWWDSPWGKGRPGWHIECSAMALDLLGQRLDIHTGGVDLIFPHHENEIAQSEGVMGHRWVNHWVHGEFLMVEGEKMSKSLGNFFTLRDLVAKGIDPIAFRFAIQSNHYRKLYNFSFEGLRAAQATLDRLRTFRSRMEEAPGSARDGAMDARIDPRGRAVRGRDEFWQAMADDLNTPQALAAILTLVTDINAQDDFRPLTREERDDVVAFLDEADRIFGAWPREQRSALDAGIEALIAARKDAKSARNWKEADRLRDELKSMGILLEDRKDGTVRWRRTE